MKRSDTMMASSSPESLVPLCVDLDGTLIHTDVLWEGIKFMLRRKPLALLGMLRLLRGGRAPFKKAVSGASTVNVDSLPWRASLIEWLRAEAAGGRPVYLVTAADSAYARAVSERLGFFTGTLASDGALNLKARKKARRLVEIFGEAGFDYIGDARADIPVWRAARRGICVKAKAGFVRRAGLAEKVEERFTGR
jgi:phosphoserine phosphatase